MQLKSVKANLTLSLASYFWCLLIDVHITCTHAVSWDIPSRAQLVRFCDADSESLEKSYQCAPLASGSCPVVTQRNLLCHAIGSACFAAPHPGPYPALAILVPTDNTEQRGLYGAQLEVSHALPESTGTGSTGFGEEA